MGSREAQPNSRQKKIPSALRAGEIARSLKKRYSDFAHYNRKNPMEELLFILCSVQTQESKYRTTYAALRRKFPRFGQLASASPSEIARPLKFGGLSRTKSKLISRLCRELKARTGRVSLSLLAKLDDAECEAFLTSLPGVGLKVARCVMMYSLGRQVFPVDTHCWRICQRLGWIRSKRDGSCTRADMDRLQDIIPEDLRLSLHVNFISLGRECCTSRNPRCSRCPILGVCPSGQSRQGALLNKTGGG